MTINLLFMIAAAMIPLAFVSGWFAHRNGAAQQRQTRASSRGLPAHYFDGLRYLIDEQPDKAIEMFIKALEVDEETVETHFALGNLFRRRGEVSRAIRIHQNLIARPSLNEDQRTLALRELGMDYLRAGLLDRAEGLFTELLDNDNHRADVLRHLLDIYQQEHDWRFALEIALRLEQVTGQDMRSIRAHFLCELAAEAAEGGHLDEARGLLQEAVGVDANCARASLMLAQLAIDEQNPRHAIELLKQVVEQDAAFATEIIEPLLSCHRATGEMDALFQYLDELMKKHTGISSVLLLAQLWAEQGDIDKAIEVIVTELHQRPTVRGVDRLVEYSLMRGNGPADEFLRLLKEFTEGLLEEKAAYSCHNCGFAGQSLHWRCPSCKRWGAVKPIHGIEGE